MQYLLYTAAVNLFIRAVPLIDLTMLFVYHKPLYVDPLF